MSRWHTRGQREEAKTSERPRSCLKVKSDGIRPKTKILGTMPVAWEGKGREWRKDSEEDLEVEEDMRDSSAVQPQLKVLESQPQCRDTL